MSQSIKGKDNFIWLLVALVFLLFSDALFAQFDAEQAQRLVNITLMVTIVAAVWAVDTVQGRWVNWKIGMSIIIVIVMIGDSVVESNFLAIYQLSSRVTVAELLRSICAGSKSCSAAWWTATRSSGRFVSIC